jgi:hypothetical protein
MVGFLFNRELVVVNTVIWVTAGKERMSLKKKEFLRLIRQEK